MAYYADLLLDSYIDICKWRADQNEAIPALSLDVVLDGALGWHQYSYGGCALVYDGDIAKTVVGYSGARPRCGVGSVEVCPEIRRYVRKPSKPATR